MSYNFIRTSSKNYLILVDHNGKELTFSSGDLLYLKTGKREIEEATEIIVPRVIPFLVPKILKEIQGSGYQMGNLRLAKPGIYFKTKKLLGSNKDETFVPYGSFSYTVDEDVMTILRHDGMRFRVAMDAKGFANLCLLPTILAEVAT